MSGGSFEYAYIRVESFVATLEIYLANANKEDRYGCTPYKFEPATMRQLRKILATAQVTAKLMREAEWLYSGDNGDESFLRNVQAIIDEAVNAVE